MIDIVLVSYPTIIVAIRDQGIDIVLLSYPTIIGLDSSYQRPRDRYVLVSYPAIIVLDSSYQRPRDGYCTLIISNHHCYRY